MAQTLQYGMSLIFYFSTYLEKEIHNGLGDINKAKVEEHFYWYSMLLYINLYKSHSNFSKEIKLETKRDGERLPVQL